MFILLALACDLPTPPSGEPEVAKPSCDVDVTKLAGTQWVYQAPQPVGPPKPEPAARVRFRDEGGALKADYTAGSTSDVFKYDCAIEGMIVKCLETEPHAEAFCKAWAAVNEGVCDPAGVSAATGIPLDVVTKAAESVNAELKKLKGDEIAQQRKSDNSPSNKMRGKFNAAVDPGTCEITLQDKYQTMVGGKLNEYENVLGSAKFARVDTDFTWESCKDADSAWAPGADDTHAAVQPGGAIKFSAIMQKEQKGAAGCIYTADLYKDYVKAQSEMTTTEDAKYGPRWDTTITLAEKGKHVVYFDRYKTCDGKRERIGNTCAMVRVE